MNTKSLGLSTGVVLLCCFAACAAYGAQGTAAVGVISEQKLAQLVPGTSTKAQVQRLLGTPWRVVQFNDCGGSMPGQADETWDYRGRESNGSTYRVHIEFDERNVAHLVAKIPDNVLNGKGTAAKVAPADSAKSMPMSAKSMQM